MPDRKTCSLCACEYDIAHFRKDARTTDGYSQYCDFCREGRDPGSVDDPPLTVPKLQCRKCEQWRDRADFGNDKRYASGKAPWCRDCVRSYQKAYRERRPGHNPSERTLADSVRGVLDIKYGRKTVREIIRDNDDVTETLRAWFPRTNPDRLRDTLMRMAEDGK